MVVVGAVDVASGMAAHSVDYDNKENHVNQVDDGVGAAHPSMRTLGFRSCCQSENADGKYCAERRLGRGGNRYAAEVGNCRDERNDGRLELAYNVLIQAKNTPHTT